MAGILFDGVILRDARRCALLRVMSANPRGEVRGDAARLEP
jgi:hypothetical protein